MYCPLLVKPVQELATTCCSQELQVASNYSQFNSLSISIQKKGDGTSKFKYYIVNRREGA